MKCVQLESSLIEGMSDSTTNSMKLEVSSAPSRQVRRNISVSVCHFLHKPLNKPVTIKVHRSPSPLCFVRALQMQRSLLSTISMAAERTCKRTWLIVFTLHAEAGLSWGVSTPFSSHVLCSAQRFLINQQMAFSSLSLRTQARVSMQKMWRL